MRYFARTVGPCVGDLPRAPRRPETMNRSELLQTVASAIPAEGPFASIEVLGDRIRCHAKDAPAPAWYELAATDDGIIVRFATPDRWLSESVETDLMHFGDPIEELIEEELAELGWNGSVPTVRHFRDYARLYTFENTVPTTPEQASETARLFLLAYEQAFRALGDVGGGDEDE